MLWKGTELGKLGKLGRAACAVRGKPGAAILWFRPLHHHLVPTPRNSCSVQMGAQGCGLHTASVGHTPLTPPNGIQKWQNRTRTNGLSGNERNNGRNKRKLAPGTFITLPWAKENRALALYQINLKKKKKKRLSQPHSFGHYHYKANRNKVSHELWAVCSVLSPLPPEAGEASPQEMLL